MKKNEIYGNRLGLIYIVDTDKKNAHIEYINFIHTLKVGTYKRSNRKLGEEVLLASIHDKYKKIKNILIMAIQRIQDLFDELKTLPTQWKELHEGDISIKYDNFIYRTIGYEKDAAWYHHRFEHIYIDNDMVSVDLNNIDSIYLQKAEHGEAYIDQEKANAIFNKIQKIYDTTINVADIIMKS